MGLCWRDSRSGCGTPAPPNTTRRAVAEVLGAGAAFAVAFGIAFGEFFGDLGARWFGMRPLLLDREHALLPFLALAVAIGAVHIVLGLALGVINASHGHPRQAVGKGASLVMVLLIVVVLLAAFEVLPHGLLTPSVIGLLVLFPVLIVGGRMIAPMKFLRRSATFSPTPASWPSAPPPS